MRHPLPIAVLLIACFAAPAAAKEVNARTVYDDDEDVFITSGWVGLEVPLPVLARVAGDFATYGDWSLRGINRKASGKKFITLLNAVRFLPGGAGGRGAFDVHFDIDLVWPFGSTDNIIRFGIKQARTLPGGGVDRLEVTLHGENTLLDDFHLVLEATGDDKVSIVRFRSRVKVDGFFDTFFTLDTYRRNVEYRIVKVIENLKHHLDQRGPPAAAAKDGVAGP